MPVLLDRVSDFFVAPVGRFGAAVFSQIPALLEAYRTGGGVSWDRFGADARTAQADFNRPFFLNGLVPGYLLQIPGLDDALRRPGARAAEIGCGGGWALIALARAYPDLVLDGFDIDQLTVELARQNVAEAGLQDRITVHCRDAAGLDLDGQFDLVSALECIHDMPDPVAVLATMKRLARPDGTVIVMDERVGDRFGNIGDFNERLFYGFSIGVCLPDGMSHQPSRATGTVMRAPVFEGYAREAGFARVERLPLEHDLSQFYRLEP